MLETTKLLGSTQSKITKDKNCKNLPHLEITEIILVHCNINSVCTFVPNKSFGQVLGISPKSFIFLKTFDSDFYDSEVWFASEPLEKEGKINIEDKIDITLIIKGTSTDI